MKMGEEVGQSPVPQGLQPKIKPVLMDFPDAIRQVILGKRITRLEWPNKEVFGFLNGNMLSLHKQDGKNYQWLVSDGDLLADDWIVLS